MADVLVPGAGNTTLRLVDMGDGTHAPQTSGAGGGGGGGGDASATNQVTGNTRIGDVAETAPASDTASSGLNGRLQRIAQRLTALIALLPASLGSKAASASLSIVDAALDTGTDRSSSVTTGGTAQALAASNTARRSLTGQNISSGDLWINEIGGTAAADTAGSYRIPSGSAFAVSTNRAISIVGATTGQKFTATEI